ncbi:MAG: hypothetical protein M3Y77_01885 [Actinomycetota bacterium]|nr:hypothetical protein [Actinomycetota bacterium]
MTIINLQQDRSAAIDTPLSSLNFYASRPASSGFQHSNSGFDSVDCTAGAAPTPPAGDCLIERGDFSASPFAFRDNGDPISIGYSGIEAPIGPGQSVKVTIYSYQVAASSPLQALLLYATPPDVTAPTQVSLP